MSSTSTRPSVGVLVTGLAALLVLAAAPAHGVSMASGSANVRFAGPPTNLGIDLNGDGLYDELVVRVPIQVNVSAEILVFGSLQTPAIGAPLLGGNPRFLVPGAYVWNLTLDGLMLRESGYNGTYGLRISLYLDGQGVLAQLNYTTPVYDYTQFTPPSATFRGAITTQPLDTNGNGLADRLLLQVPLHVLWAGDYLVGASVDVLPAGRLVHLLPGDDDVTLSFGGIAVNRLATDGPWNVTLSVVRLDGSPYDRSLSFPQTPTMSRSQFESRAVVYWNGNVSHGAGCWNGNLLLVDPTTGFAMPGTFGKLLCDNSFHLPAYNATFEAYAKLNLYPSVPVVFQVTLAGDTTRDITIPGLGPDDVNRTLALPGANTTEETMRYTTVQLASAVRFWADQDGNPDGIANASELASYLSYADTMDPVTFAPLGLMSAIRLDDQTLRHGALVASNLSGEGSVVSTQPISATLSRTWATGVPAVPGTHHAYSMTIGISTNLSAGTDRITLPAGSNGTLSISGGATVENLAPGDWLIQPTYSGVPGVFTLCTVTIAATLPPDMTAPPGGSSGGTAGTPPAVTPWLLLPGLAGAILGVATAAAYVLGRRRKRREPPAKT